MQSTQKNQVYMGGGTWKQLISEDNCPGPCASTFRLGPLVERPARIASMGPPPFGDGNLSGQHGVGQCSDPFNGATALRDARSAGTAILMLRLQFFRPQWELSAV